VIEMLFFESVSMASRYGSVGLVAQMHESQWVGLLPNLQPTNEEDIEMKNLLKRLWQEERGQDLVEYSFLLAFVALAATAGMNYLASAINTTLSVAAQN
jgi:Flp pilus assembly pilin Flp